MKDFLEKFKIYVMKDFNCGLSNEILSCIILNFRVDRVFMERF